MTYEISLVLALAPMKDETDMQPGVGMLAFYYCVNRRAYYWLYSGDESLRWKGCCHMCRRGRPNVWKLGYRAEADQMCDLLGLSFSCIYEAH